MAQVTSNCHYQHYLNNNIHKLILQNDSKLAVDEALIHLGNILDEHTMDKQLRLFIDARAGVPPLQYFFAELRKLYGQREQLPEIRAVYLYEDSVVLSVLQVFFKALGLNAKRRFIKGGTEIQAQEWLLSNEGV